MKLVFLLSVFAFAAVQIIKAAPTDSETQPPQAASEDGPASGASTVQDLTGADSNQAQSSTSQPQSANNAASSDAPKQQ